MPIPETRELDLASLRALAHPMRVRLLDELVFHGPATASALARAIAESSGATSYHLRQLARHGFVEDDPDRPVAGRERWWRASRGGFTVSAADLERSPTTREAAGLVVRELHRGRRERLERWLDELGQAPGEWASASADASYEYRLTPSQLAELVADVHTTLMRYKPFSDAAKDGATSGDEGLVEIQFAAFPVDVKAGGR